MTLNDEQLELLEKMAAIYLPVTDIATILGIYPEDLRFEIQKSESPISIAYRRGKAASKVKLRTQEMQLAMVGSPLALATVQQNLMDMEDDE